MAYSTVALNLRMVLINGVLVVIKQILIPAQLIPVSVMGKRFEVSSLFEEKKPYFKLVKMVNLRRALRNFLRTLTLLRQSKMKNGTVTVLLPETSISHST